METQNEVINIPNGSLAVQAIYTNQGLAEYNTNPLIQALPPIWSQEDFVEQAAIYPNFDPDERNLDAKYRFHCVERLLRYFEPLNRHIELEQVICVMIRQGYLARNPLEPEYALRSRQIHQAITQGGALYLENFVNVKTSACGFTLIGLSGGGKSTAIERILSIYPQVIVHSDYQGNSLSLYQVVWLKLDCPHAGSLKGLCIDFFLAIDKLLGTNSFSKFGNQRNSEDMMLAQMAQLASTHCLGVLVIDEIQNLTTAKSGTSERMLNFFVKLANTIGVPIIRIGTNKALPILQGNFRQARRGVGQGGMVWSRLNQDEEWMFFIEGMFEYQWTKKSLNFTAELSNLLYEESQGIIDIAVKLYMMSQWRAIANGIEVITPEILQQVVADSLHLVRPMLDALKSGDLDRIAKYEDISPLDTTEYERKCLSKIESREKALRRTRALRHPSQVDVPTNLQQVILGLMELDVEPSLAKSFATRVLASDSGNTSVPLLIKEAYQLVLKEGIVSKNKAVTVKQNSPKTKLTKDDLRLIVSAAKKNQMSGYEALLSEGFIKTPIQEFLK